MHNLYTKERGMKSKVGRKTVIFLSVTFILICWVSEGIAVPVDSADVEILYNTSYPGHFAKMVVRLKNPMPIAGFQFMITLSNPELINFHTDSIRVKIDTNRVDTCTWTPPPPHDSTCFKDSVVHTIARYCYIDTVGSLISDFATIECRGEVGDTSLPDCKILRILGFAQSGDSIGGYPNYRTLLKFGVDALCIPDSVTDRTVSFYMFPGVFNHLSSPQGNTVPFRYHIGQLTTWWALPGDVNGDSIVNAGDVVFLVSYLFRNGKAPCVPEPGDVTGDCIINAGDVVYLVAYLFRGGPAPKLGCWYGKQEE